MPHANVLRPALAACVLVMLAGCDQDADSQAVSKAARISQVTASSQELAVSSYNDVLSTLDAISNNASAGNTEAANAMRGAARSGLASTLANATQELEFDVREQTVVLRATISKWQRLTAQAEAAAQISTQDELREIESLMTDRRKDREEYLASKADFDARVSELDEQIESFQGLAAEQRDSAGLIQLELTRVPATEAPALAERIREHTLRADELDRRASELQTARDQIAPESREASLNVEKIETQLDLLDRQRAEAQAREQAAQEDEAAATQTANAVLTQLRGLVAQLQTSFTELNSAYDNVLRELRESQTASQQANEIVRNTSALAKAVSEQAKGNLNARRSAMLAELSRTYGMMIAAGAPIENAESLSGDYLEQAQQAHTEATEAYAQAASALNRATAQDREVADRLREAAATLERLAATEFGQIPDLTAAPEPAEDDFMDDDFMDDQDALDEPAVDAPDGEI